MSGAEHTRKDFSRPRSVLAIHDPLVAQSARSVAKGSADSAKPAAALNKESFATSAVVPPDENHQSPIDKLDRTEDDEVDKSNQICHDLVTQGSCSLEGNGCEYSHDKKLLTIRWTTSSLQRKPDKSPESHPIQKSSTTASPAQVLHTNTNSHSSPNILAIKTPPAGHTPSQKPSVTLGSSHFVPIYAEQKTNQPSTQTNAESAIITPTKSTTQTNQSTHPQQQLKSQLDAHNSNHHTVWPLNSPASLQPPFSSSPPASLPSGHLTFQQNQQANQGIQRNRPQNVLAIETPTNSNHPRLENPLHTQNSRPAYIPREETESTGLPPFLSPDPSHPSFTRHTKAPQPLPTTTLQQPQQPAQSPGGFAGIPTQKRFTASNSQHPNYMAMDTNEQVRYPRMQHPHQSHGYPIFEPDLPTQQGALNPIPKGMITERQTSYGGVIMRTNASLVDKESRALEYRDVLLEKSLNVLRYSEMISSDQHFFIDHYESLANMDPIPAGRDKRMAGFKTSIFKVLSGHDGRVYALRYIDGFRTPNDSVFHNYVTRWRRISHPNIVKCKEIFLHNDANSLGDSITLCILSEYYNGSMSLEQKIASSHGRGIITEALLWTVAFQLLNALRVIHKNGLAYRLSQLSHILISEDNRIRLSGAGLADFLTPSKKPVEQLQQDDLVTLGATLFCLGCENIGAAGNMSSHMDVFRSKCSSELSGLVFYLMQNTTTKSVEDILRTYSSQLMDEYTNSLCLRDILENRISQDIESARLFRLMVKLGVINERPDHPFISNWSETGERYMLKLFRDFVFHQIDESGKPVIDLGHIVDCLNKLDAGCDERIMLMDREEKNILVVTYKDLKKSIEQSFDELMAFGRLS